MYTLLMILYDYDNISNIFTKHHREINIMIFCPFCDKENNKEISDIIEKNCFCSSDDFENDDYVYPNCLFNCPKHGENFICPTSQTGGGNYFDLENGIIKDNCCVNLEYGSQEFLDFLSNLNIDLDNILSKTDQKCYYYYKVNILKLKGILRHDDISCKEHNNYINEIENNNLENIPFNNIDCYNHSEINDDKRGEFFYQAFCEICNKVFIGNRYGD